MITSQRTALYRYFNASGELLYVGITHRIKQRRAEHARDYASTWWPLVADSTVEWFPNRSQAARAEITAIAQEKPLHNVLHTPRHRVPIGSRRSADWRMSDSRGAYLVGIIQDVLGEEPFTQADIHRLAGMSKSAVTKNVRALVAREILVAVGTRRDMAARAGRAHTLYALAGTSAASGGRLVQVIPSSRATRAVNGSLSRRTEAVLETARQHFGKRPFTRADLLQVAGLSKAMLRRHVATLEKRSLFLPAGKQPPVGRTGYAAQLYVVAEPAA